MVLQARNLIYFFVLSKYEFAKLIGEVRGVEFVHIKFEIAENLAYWSAEISGKLIAKGEL